MNALFKRLSSWFSRLPFLVNYASNSLSRMNFLYSSKEMYMTKQTLHLHTWSTLKCQKVEMQFSSRILVFFSSKCSASRFIPYHCVGNVFKNHMGLSSSWKWKHWKLDYCFANSMILFPTEHITQREDVYALKNALKQYRSTVNTMKISVIF